MDLFTLLAKPSPNYLVPDPGELFVKNPMLYEKKAREMTQKYAIK